MRTTALAAMVTAACVVTSLFTVRHTQAQDAQPAVAGRVVQGTAGARLPERLQIVLLTIDSAAGQIAERATADTDAEGRFTFGSTLAGPGMSHRLLANTGEGLYSQQLDLSNVADRSNVELKVWETTTALDSLKTATYSVLLHPAAVDRRSRQVGLLSVVKLKNEGDRVWAPNLTVTTGMPNLLRFSLPEGYVDLRVEHQLPAAGNQFEVGTGFALADPVPPGEFDLLFTYILPYKGDSFEFPLNLFYGADSVRILVPEGPISVSGEGLSAAESVVFGDSVFKIYEARSLLRDEQIRLRFAGLPQPSLTGKVVDFFEGRLYVLVIIWVAAAVMIGLLAYAFIASRRRARAIPAMAAAGGGDMSAGGPAEETLSERQRLVAEIAALDDQHAAGNIGDAEHTAKREELKQRALRLGREAGDARQAAT